MLWLKVGRRAADRHWHLRNIGVWLRYTVWLCVARSWRWSHALMRIGVLLILHRIDTWWRWCEVALLVRLYHRLATSHLLVDSWTTYRNGNDRLVHRTCVLCDRSSLRLRWRNVLGILLLSPRDNAHGE